MKNNFLSEISSISSIAKNKLKLEAVFEPEYLFSSNIPQLNPQKIPIIFEYKPFNSEMNVFKKSLAVIMALRLKQAQILNLLNDLQYAWYNEPTHYITQSFFQILEHAVTDIENLKELSINDNKTSIIELIQNQQRIYLVIDKYFVENTNKSYYSVYSPDIDKNQFKYIDSSKTIDEIIQLFEATFFGFSSEKITRRYLNLTNSSRIIESELINLFKNTPFELSLYDNAKLALPDIFCEWFLVDDLPITDVNYLIYQLKVNVAKIVFLQEKIADVFIKLTQAQQILLGQLLKTYQIKNKFILTTEADVALQTFRNNLVDDLKDYSNEKEAVPFERLQQTIEDYFLSQTNLLKIDKKVLKKLLKFYPLPQKEFPNLKKNVRPIVGFPALLTLFNGNPEPFFNFIAINALNDMLSKIITESKYLKSFTNSKIVSLAKNPLLKALFLLDVLDAVETVTTYNPASAEYRHATARLVNAMAFGMLFVNEALAGLALGPVGLALTILSIVYQSLILYDYFKEKYYMEIGFIEYIKFIINASSQVQDIFLGRDLLLQHLFQARLLFESQKVYVSKFLIKIPVVKEKTKEAIACDAIRQFLPTNEQNVETFKFSRFEHTQMGRFTYSKRYICKKKRYSLTPKELEVDFKQAHYCSENNIFSRIKKTCVNEIKLKPDCPRERGFLIGNSFVPNVFIDAENQAVKNCYVIKKKCENRDDGFNNWKIIASGIDDTSKLCQVSPLMINGLGGMIKNLKLFDETKYNAKIDYLIFFNPLAGDIYLRGGETAWILGKTVHVLISEPDEKFKDHLDKTPSYVSTLKFSNFTRLKTHYYWVASNEAAMINDTAKYAGIFLLLKHNTAKNPTKSITFYNHRLCLDKLCFNTEGKAYLELNLNHDYYFAEDFYFPVKHTKIRKLATQCKTSKHCNKNFKMHMSEEHEIEFSSPGNGFYPFEYKGWKSRVSFGLKVKNSAGISFFKTKLNDYVLLFNATLNQLEIVVTEPCIGISQFLSIFLPENERNAANNYIQLLATLWDIPLKFFIKGNLFFLEDTLPIEIFINIKQRDANCMGIFGGSNNKKNTQPKEKQSFEISGKFYTKHLSNIFLHFYDFYQLIVGKGLSKIYFYNENKLDIIELNQANFINYQGIVYQVHNAHQLLAKSSFNLNFLSEKQKAEDFSHILRHALLDLTLISGHIKRIRKDYLEIIDFGRGKRFLKLPPETNIIFTPESIIPFFFLPINRSIYLTVKNSLQKRNKRAIKLSPNLNSEVNPSKDSSYQEKLKPKIILTDDFPTIAKSAATTLKPYFFTQFLNSVMNRVLNLLLNRGNYEQAPKYSQPMFNEEKYNKQAYTKFKLPKKHYYENKRLLIFEKNEASELSQNIGFELDQNLSLANYFLSKKTQKTITIKNFLLQKNECINKFYNIFNQSQTTFATEYSLKP